MHAVRIESLGVYTRGDLVLLGEKKTGEIGKGLFNGPGGKCEHGESPAACLVRESWEELRLRLTEDMLRHVAVLHCYADGRKSSIVHVFRAELTDQHPHETADMRPGWFPICGLPYDRMHEADRAWFERALAGKRLIAHIHYERPGDGFIGIAFKRYRHTY